LRVFLAGATGAIGRFLLPMLVDEGHDVAALVRSSDKSREIEARGVRVFVADALDRDALTAAVVAARPDAVIHQLTALAGVGNFKKFDEEFARTNRLRTEVTDTLLAAARIVGSRRFIAQSFCGWPFAREGGPVKTEDAPLDPNPAPTFRSILDAIRHLEDAVRGATCCEAFALRYGFFYGPGTAIGKDGAVADLVRRRQLPIVGGGTGVWSFVHVADAARAAVAALTRGTPGVYNVVDDEPAPVFEWLPALAQAVGAKPPRRVPAWIGRLAIGEGGVTMMTTVRGGSNAKAKREMGWHPAHTTWRQGFREGLG
jgi:nucleoside-diphosphate-sugar epimerase